MLKFLICVCGWGNILKNYLKNIYVQMAGIQMVLSSTTFKLKHIFTHILFICILKTFLYLINV